MDVRVLIIDDASTDDTPEVAAALAAEDARVEFRRHAVNRGHIATFNEGLEWISGDYNLLLSADDLLVPGALSRACQLFDAHPQVGLVHGGCQSFHADKPLPSPRVTTGEPRSQIRDGIDWLESVCERGDTILWTPTAIVRTSVQRRLGKYRPELPLTTDLEMWMRIAWTPPWESSMPTKLITESTGKYAHSRIWIRLGGLTTETFSLQHFLQRSAPRLLPNSKFLHMKAVTAIAEEALHWAYVAFHSGEAKKSQELMQFATSLRPEIRTSRLYRRLSWKHAWAPGSAPCCASTPPSSPCFAFQIRLLNICTIHHLNETNLAALEPRSADSPSDR